MTNQVVYGRDTEQNSCQQLGCILTALIEQERRMVFVLDISCCAELCTIYHYAISYRPGHV